MTAPNAYCPVYAPFFSSLGAAFAVIFCSFGAAYGTAKSGLGLAALGVLRPDMVVRSVIPVVMAGIVGIYGLVVAVMISGSLNAQMELYNGFVHLGAGLAVGLGGLAAGFAIGIAGDAGLRATAQQPRVFTGVVLVLIFAEVLGLYGLIVGLILNSKSDTNNTLCK